MSGWSLRSGRRPSTTRSVTPWVRIRPIRSSWWLRITPTCASAIIRTLTARLISTTAATISRLLAGRWLAAPGPSAGQLFVQWVFHRDSVPRRLEDRFELYSAPVETYQALGVPAYHRPVNDIHVAGKKIGGTGAAQLGESEVLVGSLMFTFDKATIAHVLKVTSEKMRDKIFESLGQYMTTLAEQLHPLPDPVAVRDLYLTRASAALGREIAAGGRRARLNWRWPLSWIANSSQKNGSTRRAACAGRASRSTRMFTS